MMQTNRDNYGVCVYCANQVLWKQRIPHDADGKRHRCKAKPKAIPRVVTRTIEPQDLIDLRNEIGTLAARVDKLANPKPEPTNILDERVKRIENLLPYLARKYEL